MTTRTTAEVPLTATKHGLDVETRTQAIALLNARLADVIDLELQAKQAHWNVKGPNFIGLHELFDQVAEAAAKFKDEIAERAVMLGGIAVGTAQAVVERTTLPPYPAEAQDWHAHVDCVSSALARFGTALRQAIEDATELEDAVTADLFTEIAHEIDKYMWFVEAHASRP
ncbi:DNA starvation/stationary phase protection protein [Luteitalea sp. TBR-22]|uniref:DNA starvation/stationary phase protection protein Dps n=1 Tax=Luteitalea sp. TBR-22 TaxID=2802971 RepID=UPI001AF83321|nr:DNA starvation/stationary phase protection protein Dps [Luteitalea sp. TBR-22]BCS31581.1 DNA starvation/stationary phase protection protein [Luteitalea sp. TBR-22]